MAKSMFDADALISSFESATAQQSQQLRKAAADATMTALQGRELTLKNIRAALKAVTEAAGTGAAKNLTAGVDAEALLDKAVAGMDDALLKAVEANRVALGQLVSQGADLREKHLKKAAAGVEGPMAGAWTQVLEKMQAGGTLSGAKASSAAEQLAEQMQGAMRSSRAASMRAAQVLAESYTAMVSGVLIGMSDALQAAAATKKTPTRK